MPNYARFIAACLCIIPLNLSYAADPPMKKENKFSGNFIGDFCTAAPFDASQAKLAGELTQYIFTGWYKDRLPEKVWCLVQDDYHKGTGQCRPDTRECPCTVAAEPTCPYFGYLNVEVVDQDDHIVVKMSSYHNDNKRRFFIWYTGTPPNWPY